MSVTLLLISAIPSGLFGSDFDPKIELHAELQNAVRVQNDADFDRTALAYDENGQTAGTAATVFKPSLRWHITKNLRLRYEAELGLNYWSKNNPDQIAAISQDVFVLKHREVYSEGEFDGAAIGLHEIGFRVGYAPLQDSTGLFLKHWIGAAQVWGAWSDDLRLSLFAGQVPDQTYEGITMLDNNFLRDIYVLGARTWVDLGDSFVLDASVTGLIDNHLVGKGRFVVVPSVHFEAKRGAWSAFADGVLQLGGQDGVRPEGGAQTTVAWAAAGRFTLGLNPVELEFNVLALSPDDKYEANSVNYAFLYSGKSKSATVLLTENERRDWYDNLDERMSTYSGGFFQNRAGLLVTDAKVTWRPLDWLSAGAIVGSGFALKPQNAMGDPWYGLEGDLFCDFALQRYLVLNVTVGGLLPGSAGGAKLNRVNPANTDPMGFVEASLLVAY